MLVQGATHTESATQATSFDPWEGSMLLILTGDIQIGKTRWLQNSIARLEAAGVVVEGVVAPGVWRTTAKGDAPEAAGASSDPHVLTTQEPSTPEASQLSPLACDAVSTSAVWNPAPGVSFDKLGIDNELLPSHELIPFARREDLARAEGTFDANAQAAKEGLTWHIDDSAIDRVNRHFDALQQYIDAEKARLAEEAQRATETHDAAGASRRRRLLVVDELGRLELLRGQGLTSAMDLLAKGPQGYYDHAVVVARDLFGINNRTRDLFGDAWGGAQFVGPGDAAWKEWLEPLAR